MKKLFTLTSFLLAGLASKAQTIAGGDFESFHPVQIASTSPTITSHGFASWYGLDSFAIYTANTYLHPVTDTLYKIQVFNTNQAHVGVAAKLQTRIQDTLHMTASCISNCAPGWTIPPTSAATFFSTLTFTGGTPLTITQRPATVGVWIEYAPAGNDTAHIKINVLDSNNNVIGTADSMISATIATYTYVTPHITYTSTHHARTLQVILMSSPLGYNRGQEWSTLWVDDVNYTLATGVNEVNADQKAVKFGPNPSTGIVYLYSNVSEKLNWQVYNTNGQVVVSKDLAANNREDLSYLPSGTYFYNITNSKGEVVQKDKFTIAK